MARQDGGKVNSYDHHQHKMENKKQHIFKPSCELNLDFEDIPYMEWFLGVPDCQASLYSSGICIQISVNFQAPLPFICRKISAGKM